MSSPSPVITCSGLDFTWPDGTPVLTGVSLAIGPGRTGLIGLNGSGKSTLLRLIAGELTPARGSVAVAGELGYVPQDVTLTAGLRVDEALGVAPALAALRAIEAGDPSEENFAQLFSAVASPGQPAQSTATTETPAAATLAERRSPG